jgi:hypothetical protein
VEINLNTGLAMEQIPGTNTIIYPQEIWDGFNHRRTEGRGRESEASGKKFVSPEYQEGVSQKTTIGTDRD